MTAGANFIVGGEEIFIHRVGKTLYNPPDSVNAHGIILCLIWGKCKGERAGLKPAPAFQFLWNRGCSGEKSFPGEGYYQTRDSKLETRNLIFF